MVTIILEDLIAGAGTTYKAIKDGIEEKLDEPLNVFSDIGEGIKNIGKGIYRGALGYAAL